MTLLFSLVSNKLNHKVLIELVNSTPRIRKVILIQKGKKEINFNRNIDIVKIDYDKILLGDFADNENYFKLEIEENNFFKKHHMELLYMMNRIHRLYSFPFNERYYMLKNQIKGAIGLFNKHKPDFCFFMNMPHEIFDYTLFKVADYRKIKRRFLLQGAQLGSYYQILGNLRGNEPKLKDYKNKSEVLSNTLERIVKNYQDPFYKVFYMKKGWTNHSRSQKGLSKIRFKIKNHIDFLNESKKKNKFLEYIIISTIFNKIENFLLRFSSFLKLNHKLSKEYKYIYVPLHLEPELTTSPMGGDFFDQMEMIELLNRNCPPDFKIIVKEHPVQKLNHTRDKLFFKKIKSLENVIYLSKSKEDFINVSEIIATITGTSGFEALCRNKKVLVFGEPFYMHYEGCFKIQEDNDFINFINDMDKKNTNITELYKFLNNCLDHFNYGYIDLDFESQSKISFNENINGIVLNIKKSIMI